MRIFSAGLICFAAIGCSVEAQQPQAAPGAERIACALAGAQDFADECLVERSTAEGARLLVVRHPDGGIRRFEQVDDGRGLISADGADEVVPKLDGDILEVGIADDRYRFPATLRGGDAPAQ